MIKPDFTTRAARVKTLRDMVQPVEDLAANGGIQFDTIIKPGSGRNFCDQLNMAASLMGATIEIEEANPTTALMADGYAQFLEGWAARMLEVAAAMRKQFPTPAVETK